MKKYAQGGELPQAMVDRMAREENEADREMIAGPLRRLGRRLKENVMGTEEQNAAAEASEIERARKNPQGNEAKFRRMMGKEFKAGGKVSSASKRADGCAIKGKTKGRMI